MTEDDIPSPSTEEAAQDPARPARPPRKKKSRSKAAKATAIARAAAQKAWDEEQAARTLRNMLPLRAANAERSAALAETKRQRTIVLDQLTAVKVQYLVDHIEEHGHRWLTPADEPLIKQCARNLAIADQLWSYMEQRQAIDTHGRPRGAMKLWVTLQNALRQQLSALGLSPLARSDIGANTASAALDVAQALRAARAAEAEARREGRPLAAELS